MPSLRFDTVGVNSLLKKSNETARVRCDEIYYWEPGTHVT